MSEKDSEQNVRIENSSKPDSTNTMVISLSDLTITVEKIENKEDDNLTKSLEGNFTSHIKDERYGQLMIIAHTEDHGRMDFNNVLSDDKSPAHVHISVKKKQNELGELNITGPCPWSENEVNQYRPSKDKRKNTNFNNIKKYIVKWANDSYYKNEYSLENNWINLQMYWEDKIQR